MIVPRDTTANRPFHASQRHDPLQHQHRQRRSLCQRQLAGPSLRAADQVAFRAAVKVSAAASLWALAKALTGGLNNNSGGITSAGSITGVGANITGNGALTIAAGGTNQNLTLTGSGTGQVLLTPNVGIGTTSAANPLDVKGSVAIGSYAGTAAGTANSLIVSGNVGIGTTSPSYALDVQGGSLRVGSTSVYTVLNGNQVYTSGGPLYLNYSAYNTIINGAAGLVGIGTTSPGNSLDIESSTQYRGLWVGNGTNQTAKLVGLSASNGHRSSYPVQ